MIGALPARNPRTAESRMSEGSNRWPRVGGSARISRRACAGCVSAKSSVVIAPPEHPKRSARVIASPSRSARKSPASTSTVYGASRGGASLRPCPRRS